MRGTSEAPAAAQNLTTSPCSASCGDDAGKYAGLNKGNPAAGSGSRQAQLIKGQKFIYEDDEFYNSSKEYQEQLKNKFGIK